jgi:hypothetical protein
MTFVEWLAEGQKNVTGAIAHVNVRTKYLLVAPDAFPHKSFYYGTKHWTDSQRFHARFEGRVLFDVPAQDPPVDHNAVAQNVRLQDSAKAE